MAATIRSSPTEPLQQGLNKATTMESQNQQSIRVPVPYRDERLTYNYIRSASQLHSKSLDIIVNTKNNSVYYVVKLDYDVQYQGFDFDDAVSVYDALPPHRRGVA